MKKGTFLIGNIMSFTIFAALIIFSVTSCREEKTKETVIIEKQVETPKAKEDGTSLKVGSDGVEFSTKKGDKKTEITIKD